MSIFLIVITIGSMYIIYCIPGKVRTLENKIVPIYAGKTREMKKLMTPVVKRPVILFYNTYYAFGVAPRTGYYNKIM